jgi:hypothetical protein
MQFSYLQNGVAVQVVSRITMPFRTVRPAGVEAFGSAHNYFERGRHVSFPSAGNGPAYVLGMLIRVTDVSAAGTVPKNTFELPEHQWKRAFIDEAR